MLAIRVGVAHVVLQEVRKMSFRSTLALLLALLSAGVVLASAGARASTAPLERALGPEDLVRLERNGAVTVRALGAWGRLPAQYVTLGRTLRDRADLDLLDATSGTVADWLALAEGGDQRLAPMRGELGDLLGYLRRGDFLDWEAVADEGAVAPGELLRRDGRLWVHGPRSQDQAAAPGSVNSPPAAANGPQVLFDGDMSGRWVPYQSGGGKFKEFAKLDKGMLIVDVPSGNTWGRTGMYSNGTVVGHPRGADTGVRLTAFFDPEASSDAIVSLVPGEAKADDEWSHHHVRVGMHLEKEEGPRTMTLWIGRKAVMSREIAGVPERVDIVIRPDDAVLVTDADGKILLQGVMPPDAPQDGYRLYALTGSTSKRRGKPVRMALKRIERSPEPFAVQPAHDSIPDGAQRLTLFENGVLGRWWSPQAGQGGNFEKHASLEDGVVVVDVPPASRWGKVGVYSPSPLVWLDGFGPGSEVGVTFEFDPERTTGFAVALTPQYNLMGNDPSRPYVWGQWNLKEDGSGGTSTLLIHPDFSKGAWSVETGPQAPGKVTLRISPDGVLAEGLGGPDERFPWEWAVPNMGLRVYAFSQSEKNGLPVRMALRRITMDRVVGASAPASKPAEGVEPLEVRTLYAGPGESWEPYAVNGADFATQAGFEDGVLVADVPSGKPSWPKAGIVSRDKLIRFNERIQRTPYAVRIVCDPQRTTGVEAVFKPAKSAKMDKDASVMASLVRQESGPDAGSWVLSLSGANAIYRNWSRRLDAAWVEANWDGVLEVRFGQGWAEASLPGGPAVRGVELRSGKGWEYHMAVTTSPSGRHDASRMALKRVEGGWVTPPGMTLDERWTFVDDEDFDVEAFLDLVSGSLPEEE
jgi:hypothetical protein